MTVSAIALAALLAAACCFDVLKLRIPNAIPLAVIVLFAVGAMVDGTGDTLPGHLQALGITLALLVPAWMLGMLGGGDVKLLAAVSLWLGIEQLTAMLLLTGIAGGLFALVWLVLRWLARRGFDEDRLPASLARGAPLPFALPIMLAALPLMLAG